MYVMYTHVEYHFVYYYYLTSEVQVIYKENVFKNNYYTNVSVIERFITMDFTVL